MCGDAVPLLINWLKMSTGFFYLCQFLSAVRLPQKIAITKLNLKTFGEEPT